MGLGRGTRTWDSDVGLGRGTRTWDSDVGLGRGTRTWDSDVGLGDVGLGDTRGPGDVINKQHLTFVLNLESIIFGGLVEAILCWRAC